MANLVLPAVGAVAGYIVGGPTGAQLGWLAGSAINNSNKTTLVPAQSIGDMAIQTSEYGIGINRIVGTQRVAGNVVWYGDKRKYTKSTTTQNGGKGGGSKTITQTEGWTVDLAICICVGPIKGVRKIWANGNLIIDCTSAANPLIGQLYLGSNSQMPDPVMEASLGAGNVPAYRGLAYIVLNDYDVTLGLPQFSFEVVKDGAL